MQTIGELAAIWRYSTKSLRGERLQRAQVQQGGLPGDRAGALFVVDGHARVGKTLRGKEHDRLHLMDSPGEAVRASAQRGISVDVRSEDEHYFDDAPISIVVDRWLRDLSGHVGYTVEHARFRPNFFVRAVPDFHDEEVDLVGRELQLGDVRLRVRSSIERCVTITYDPKGGLPDPNILKYVARERNNVMGIYCDVVKPGLVENGQTIYAL